MKKITRELRVSRNTLRKILRSGETDFTCEREHQPLPKIGPWVEHVERFLQAKEGKASRERLTLIRIYEKVRALAYAGSYSCLDFAAQVGAFEFSAFLFLHHDKHDGHAARHFVAW